jgi:glutamate synthase (NADPH/NADH) large chain
MVDLEDCDAEDVVWLEELLTRHREETGSALAARILSGWPRSVNRFVKVMPRDYKRVLEAMRAAEQSGRPAEEAIMAAAHG